VRKIVSWILLGLGAFLLVTAIVATVWAPDQVKRAPIDTDSTNAAGTGSTTTSKGPKPLTYGRKTTSEIAFLWYFVAAPFLALLVAVPVAWGGFLGWHDVIIGGVFYLITGLGVTVGFHRYLTHSSFRTGPVLRWILTVSGTLAVEGSPIRWVADHRRHHQFSDEEFDPHSPWRFGHNRRGLAKGLLWAHCGWLFERDNSNARRFAPDLLADPIVRRVHNNTPYIILASTVLPPIIGGLWSMSWWGALTAFFWASLIRIGLVHHVTWSVNSVCHVAGERPFRTAGGDKATNFWPLAILSFGESWHNLHHADPTCARHGVDRGQIDISARIIWVFEKLGWASDVRWPRPVRIDGKRVP
jgi:stearoyl-CoA desaturase (delta-9 desaturase)